MARAFHLQQWEPARLFPIVDHVVTRPDRCQRFDTPSRGFKCFCPLYEMQLSVVEYCE